ncbi:MAG: redoxin domain-containing protein [Halieaceae bacterium]|nr:redoxin domain-containing protein [Halieaceae bacterium]
MAVGIGAGIYAISGGANWLGNTAAGLSIAIGIFYFILRAQSAQSSVPPIAGVGDKIPDFTALDDNGNEFQLASLQGKPFLLKFFRGHW